jgi:polysaccharide pyruvyl transferase WcaK-like protein
MRVLIFGPYGGYNLGDEFILHQIAGDIRAQGHDVVVTSGDREYTWRCQGLESWPILDIKHGRVELLSRIREADLIVVGGGEQLLESKWSNPVWGLLPNIVHLMRAARKHSKPVFFWSVGVSPTSFLGDWMIRTWLTRAELVTVRDGPSKRRLDRLGIAPERLHLAADPVFEVERGSHEQGEALIQSLERRHPAGGPVILLVAANDGRRSLDYLAPLAAGCRLAARAEGGRVLVQVMDHQARYDGALLRRPELAEDDVMEMLPLATFAAPYLRDLFAGVDVVVSARMHPLIIATTQGTPWVNVAGNSKMEALSEVLGKAPLRLASDGSRQAAAATEAVFNAVREALAIGRERWQEAVDPRLATVRQRAALSRQLFNQMHPTAAAAARDILVEVGSR